MTGLRQIADRFEVLQGELKAARTKVDNARQELEAGQGRVTQVEDELRVLRRKAVEAFDEIFGEQSGAMLVLTDDPPSDLLRGYSVPRSNAQ